MTKVLSRNLVAFFVSAVGAAGLIAGVGSASAATGADLAVSPSGFDCAVRVTNNGPDVARNVLVYPRNPRSLLVGHFPQYLGAIQPGATRTVCYGAYVAFGEIESYTAVSSTPDPDSSNNTSSS